jgi:hypothetical protein
MQNHLGIGDRFAFLRPDNGPRSAGFSSIEQVLFDCGIVIVPDDQLIDKAVWRVSDQDSIRGIRDWIKAKGITAIGFVCMLDPDESLRIFSDFMNALGIMRAHISEGGSLHSVYFAGSPKACSLVEERFPQISGILRGDESPGETLDLLGIPRSLLPERSARCIAYDDSRLSFGLELARKGDYKTVSPVDRSDYRNFGLRGDSISGRVAHGVARDLPPVFRIDMGPYLPHREEAISLFLGWTAELAKGRLVDVLSVETSHLSRGEFWRDWGGRSDGGGVPIDSPEEFSKVWSAARPMLVRSRSGTRNIEAMAQMLEESIDIAWHSLSLWWSSRLDGQGSNFVRENLREQVATLRYIAETNKPFEPDVARHFAYRGADDLTQILVCLVAAKAAKAAGIQKLILPVMLKTPKDTWGIDDLAKARALLHLARELEDSDFKVYLQATCSYDCFSHDPVRAKAQLAAATVLMDDIEPQDPTSPQILQIVGFSDGASMSELEMVNESIRISRHALVTYRALRNAGEVENMSSNPMVLERTSELLRDTRAAISAIESAILEPYGPDGLYKILSSGFLPIPFLSACRDEFIEAIHWKTKCISGSVVVIDEAGAPISAKDRFAVAAETARANSVPLSSGLGKD